MSVVNFLKDVFTGNETNAIARLKDWWTGLLPSIQALISKAETDEGKVIQGLIPVAAQDVINGGFTTASFVAAVKDVGVKLAAQSITVANTDVFALLNAEVSHQASVAGIAVPTNTGSAVVPATDIPSPAA